jgi:hypothetical protein
MTNDYNTCLEIICDFPAIYGTGAKRPVDIVKQSGYLDLAQHLTEDKIAKHINNNRDLIETWLNFSEDIRHSPAWAFRTLDNLEWTVFYTDNGKVEKEFTFDNSAEACAKMIKMTMDEMAKPV